jgi:hypothetical protein
VRLSGRTVVHVIEQEAGMGQQVRIYTKQLACLTEALPSAMHQRTDLAVKYKHVSKDAPRRQLRVGLGQRKPGLIDMADRVITGVTGSYPRREAYGILSSRNRDLPRRVRHRRPAKQRFAGQAERPAIQLDVKIPWTLIANAHCPQR